MELITNLKEKFKTLSKKQVAILASCALVVVAGGIYGVVALATSSGDSRSSVAGVTVVGTSAYMEETVSLGDIVVGTSETGTATMYQEEISFGFVTEVIEFYVKAGEDVVEGQVLALLDMDTVNEEKDALALEIADAETALAEAEADYDVQAIQAAKVLSETLYNGEMADYDYAVALTEIEENYADLAENITDLEEEWTTAVSSLYNTLDDDYSLDTLSTAKSTAYTAYQTAEDNLDDAEDDVNDLKTTYGTALINELKDISSSKFSEMMTDFSVGGAFYSSTTDEDGAVVDVAYNDVESYTFKNKCGYPF